MHSVGGRLAKVESIREPTTISACTMLAGQARRERGVYRSYPCSLRRLLRNDCGIFLLPLRILFFFPSLSRFSVCTFPVSLATISSVWFFFPIIFWSKMQNPIGWMPAPLLTTRRRFVPGNSAPSLHFRAQSAYVGRHSSINKSYLVAIRSLCTFLREIFKQFSSFGCSWPSFQFYSASSSSLIW